MAFTAADVTRWQRNRKDTIKSSVWGLMPAGLATRIIGVLLARIAGEYDISLVLAKVGIPILGLIVIITASVSTNSLNAYCGGLDTIMTFNLPDNRRREATAGVCFVGVILALTGDSRLSKPSSIGLFSRCTGSGRDDCRLLDCRQGQTRKLA